MLETCALVHKFAKHKQQTWEIRIDRIVNQILPLITPPLVGKPGEKWMCSHFMRFRPDSKIDSKFFL